MGSPRHSISLQKDGTELNYSESEEIPVLAPDHADIINDLLISQKDTDLGKLIKEYTEIRQNFYDKLKTESDNNLFKGALNFTKHLFRMQETKNEYGSNLMMKRMRDYLDKINEKNVLAYEMKKDGYA